MDMNRARGALWGLIVGDAFGSPIQFSDKDDHPRLTEMERCPVFDLPPGYWTDDGSMALCIMDSYVRRRGYDLKDIGRTFCRWYYFGYLSSVTGRAFDIGNATSEAIEAIRYRGSFVNGREESQGNGSIMRFAPTYLIARQTGNAAVMREVSDLTHASNRVRQVVAKFAGVLDAHMEGRRAVGQSVYTSREDVNNSGWAVSTLEAALWAFETTNSFEEGMIEAVNLGGDSDTIGAVYGQLAGAYYGVKAIPPRWIKAIKEPGFIDARVESFLGQLAG